MAWNPNPKVADCREIARKWGKQQVVILAVDVESNTLEYASYGETKALCSEAKLMADAAFDAIVRQQSINACVDELMKQKAQGTLFDSVKEGGRIPIP